MPIFPRRQTITSCCFHGTDTHQGKPAHTEGSFLWLTGRIKRRKKNNRARAQAMQLFVPQEQNISKNKQHKEPRWQISDISTFFITTYKTGNGGWEMMSNVSSSYALLSTLWLHQWEGRSYPFSGGNFTASPWAGGMWASVYMKVHFRSCDTNNSFNH